jgi:hypothetical protein
MYLRGERLELAPFSPAQTHALLQARRSRSTKAASEAAARSKGNPLFALQLLHAWAGAATSSCATASMACRSSSLAVRARTTAELWEERLHALPESLRFGARSRRRRSAATSARRAHAGAPRVGPGARPERRDRSRCKRAQILLGGRRRGCAGRTPSCKSTCSRSSTCSSPTPPRSSAPRPTRSASTRLASPPHRAPPRGQPHPRGATDVATLRGQLLTAIAWNKGRSREPRPRCAISRSSTASSTASPPPCNLRWRAEALRHAGRLEDARREAEEARRIFQDTGDRENEATACACSATSPASWRAGARPPPRLARARHVRRDRPRSRRAQCEVVLGEIDYLPGRPRAGARSRTGLSASRKAGDSARVRAQMPLAAGLGRAGRRLAGLRPRAAPHRPRRVRRHRLPPRPRPVRHHPRARRSPRGQPRRPRAPRRARGRQSFRDLANPRGEAACERCLAMSALDAGHRDRRVARQAPAPSSTSSPTRGARWRRASEAQIALDRGNADFAREHLIACEAFALRRRSPSSTAT